MRNVDPLRIDSIGYSYTLDIRAVIASGRFRIALGTPYTHSEMSLSRSDLLALRDWINAAVGEGVTGNPDAQIKYMVSRFLSWKLPPGFIPDNGISFDPIANKGTTYEYHREPMGTNLLDATQADAMVRYMLDGLPATDGARVPKGWKLVPIDLPQAIASVMKRCESGEMTLRQAWSAILAASPTAPEGTSPTIRGDVENGREDGE